MYDPVTHVTIVQQKHVVFSANSAKYKVSKVYISILH